MTEKPSPVLGEGGPRQWWVREFCEWKSEKNEQFEVAPHPAFSHLLLDGEGKESNDFVPLKRSNLQMKSMTEKPSPVLGEGEPRQWWVRGLQ